MRNRSRAADLTRRIPGRHSVKVNENNLTRATVESGAVGRVMVCVGVRAGADPELGAGAYRGRIRKKRWRDDAVRKRR
jgi:hypothetical protein